MSIPFDGCVNKILSVGKFLAKPNMRIVFSYCSQRFSHCAADVITQFAPIIRLHSDSTAHYYEDTFIPEIENINTCVIIDSICLVLMNVSSYVAKSSLLLDVLHQAP